MPDYFHTRRKWTLFDNEVAKMRRALGDAVRTEAELAILKEELATKDTEIARLCDALGRSVKLQSHYAVQLNTYDAGERMEFASADDWLERLAVIDAKP